MIIIGSPLPPLTNFLKRHIYNKYRSLEVLKLVIVKIGMEVLKLTIVMTGI